MRTHTAVRFRAYPTEEQARQVNRTIGCVRFVYNLMLETRIAHYQTTWEPCYPTPALYKDTYPFLREVDSFALCNAQLALEKAYKRFFEDRKTGFPKYKSKRRGRKTYTTNLSHGNIELDDKARRLKLPKLGWLAVRQHKRIPDDWKLKSVTVEHCPSGRYTATILFEYETQIPEKVKPVKTVGLDYASHGLYVSSDGEHAEYPGYYRKMQDKLAREQCKLSHMVKGSANWRKQCKRVARLYEKTANQRRDYQHKKANRIVASYDMVGVEALSMKKHDEETRAETRPRTSGTLSSQWSQSEKRTGEKHVGQRVRHVLHHVGIQARPSRQTVGSCGQMVSVQPTMPRLRLQESSGQGFKRPRMGVPIMWSVA